MPLNPMTFQDDFESKMLEWTLIADKNDPVGINQNDNPPPDFDFTREFTESYKKYAEEGMIVGVDITAMSENGRSAMEAAMSGITGSNAPQSLIMANAFASFWAAIVGPETHTLEHGGIGGAGVTNTAMAMVGAIDGAIKSSITDAGSGNAWAELIEAVEGVIKTIVWTVIELFTCGTAVCPIPFPEMIS